MIPSLVSIHAPWEGCDVGVAESVKCILSFNSRTLGRVRRCRPIARPGISMFQFTHPGKGATVLLTDTLEALELFQFTHPGKGATAVLYHKPIVRYSVSIHAPWEGCDYTAALPLGRCLMFQFTHPGKGATDPN